MSWLKQIFCRHRWELILKRRARVISHNILYTYKCEKCDKIVTSDKDKEK